MKRIVALWLATMFFLALMPAFGIVLAQDSAEEDTGLAEQETVGADSPGVIEPTESSPENGEKEPDTSEGDYLPIVLLAALVGGEVHFYGVEITLKDTGESIEGMTDIDPDSDISIKIKFDVPDTSGISPGDTATITLPKEVFVNFEEQSPKTFGIPLQDTGEIIATVTLTNGSREVVITFTDVIEKYEDIFDAYFSIFCKFDKEQLGNGGPKEIVFFEDDATSYPITVHFKEIQSDIEKELYSQDLDPVTGQYTLVWKLTVNTQQIKMQNIVISDDLPEALAYKGVAFGSDALNTLPLGWMDNTTGRNVRLVHAGPASDTFEIYLHTYVEDFDRLTYQNGDQKTARVTNTVKLNATNERDESFNEVTDSAEGEVKVDFLQKQGNFSSDNLSFSWYVVVNEENLTVPNLKLMDLIPTGLEMNEASIDISPSGVTFESAPASGGTLYTFTFPSPTNETYTIQYTTDITDPSFFENGKGASYTNSAYLTWGGNGHTTTTKPVSVTLSGTYGMLTKTGRGYSQADETVSYNVQINQRYLAIDGPVTLTDYYVPIDHPDQKTANPKVSLSYNTQAGGKMEPLKENTDYTFTDNRDGTFTLVLEDGRLDKKAIFMEVTLSLTDINDYATNTGKPFYNYIEMEVGKTTYYDQGVQNSSPRILMKSFNDYDSETRLARWEIVFNQYQHTGLGAVTIVDTLNEFLKPVAVYRDAENTPNLLNTPGYVYDKTQNTLTASFDDGELDGTTLRLIIFTEVTDEFFFENRNNVTLENKVSAKMSNVTKSVEVTNNNFKLTSTLIDKEGGYDEDTGLITWRVLVNKGALDWEMGGVKLEDQLTDGLVLELDSVALYRFAVEQDGTLTDKQEVAFDPNACVSYDIDTNLFIFTFPDDMDGGYAYELIFDTFVTKAGRFNNVVKFKGFETVEENSEHTVTISEGEYAAGAAANRKYQITLTKLDETGKDLAGASFELRDANGKVIETRTSDGSGPIAFKSYLKSDTLYFLVETAAPAGYQVLSSAIEVIVKEDGNHKVIAETLTYTARNKRIPADLGNAELIKLDERTHLPIQGAVFTLEYLNEKGEWTSYEVEEQTTGADGKVYYADLPPGVYRFKELKAASGYSLFSVLYSLEAFEVTEGGGKQVFAITASNRKNTTTPPGGGETETSLNVILVKLDAQTKEPLAGAVFQLQYQNALGAWVNLGTPKETDEEGIVEFAGLDLGRYRLVETEAAPGYDKDSLAVDIEVFELKKGEGARRIIITATNEPLEPGTTDPTEPEPTEPDPTEPEPTQPEPTEPTPGETEPSDTGPGEPGPNPNTGRGEGVSITALLSLAALAALVFGSVVILGKNRKR